MYVVQKVEVFSIHPEVVQEFGMAQVVREICWEWEVTEAGHFFGGVAYHRSINGCPSLFRSFLCNGSREASSSLEERF